MTESVVTLTNYRSTDAWLHHWHCQYKDHFQAARSRIDSVYEQEFVNFKTISKRHWQHRRDVPKDLMALPRSLWRTANKIAGKTRSQSPPLPTGKAQALAHIIENELLQLSRLQTQFADHLIKHPSFVRADLDSLERTLSHIPTDIAREKLILSIDSLTQTHEGGRDFLLFVTIGLLGRGIIDKAAFGSAAALGSAAATSIYLSKQSFLAGIWLSWAGAPTWVSAAGAVGGVGSTLLLAPLLAPITEYGVNRIRARKMLGDIIDQAEAKVSINDKDLAKLAGQFGTYAQLIPDLIQLLKHFRSL